LIKRHKYEKASMTQSMISNGEPVISDPGGRIFSEKRLPSFPVDAALLTPHARPMLAVDEVLFAGSGAGRVALRAEGGAWYMRPDGRWNEVAGIELISQAAAAISGLTPPEGASEPPVCFLAEVRRYEVRGDIVTDYDVVIDIHQTGEFGGFFMVEGVMRCKETIVATAELTFWRDDRPQSAPAAEGEGADV
jgi:predicted hotdog family 3-hydroxylacyl-ACP dehydratase